MRNFILGLLSAVAVLCTSNANVSASAATNDPYNTGHNPGSFFQSKTVIIPHDDKRFRGGEDSADSNDFILTVADGVGGWALRGVNPGDYSRDLTHTVVGMAKEDTNRTPHDLIVEACNYA